MALVSFIFFLVWFEILEYFFSHKDQLKNQCESNIVTDICSHFRDANDGRRTNGTYRRKRRRITRSRVNNNENIEPHNQIEENIEPNINIQIEENLVSSLDNLDDDVEFEHAYFYYFI